MDDESAEIISNFFKESIALINNARREMHAKYPKLFPDDQHKQSDYRPPQTQEAMSSFMFEGQLSTKTSVK